MTDRYAQGTGEPHLGWSGQVRFEMLTQDRLRSGTRNVDAADVTGEDTIERRTRNLNVFADVSYGLDAAWSLTLRLPVVHRDHEHDLLDEEGGPSTRERWKFTRLGDVQLLARRQALMADGATSYALFGGLKLPTGSRAITNDQGVRAERALQPGTGTTDVVIGIAARRAVGGADAVFGQASASWALNSREDFRPGARFEAAAGWSHAFSQGIGATVQLNLRQKGRDKGLQAEPDLSGSTTLDISPGATLATGSSSTLYAYLQLPLYQRVNGTQLVPRAGFAVGWTKDF
jgi:hypothetical protein